MQPSPIHILSASVARKIAAGEVIERPHGVVRELLDNSIDSGADRIDVYLDGGGIDLIRVVDNGMGMAAGDLDLCTRSHATSKITTDDDLLSVGTLGFRGEALSSVAAVSHLEITSCTEDGTAHRLVVDGGSNPTISPSAGKPGTTVSVRDLFYNVPARKRFLKRAQAEGSLCRSVFTDRAVGFPAIEFRLFSADEMRMYLPQDTRPARIAACYPTQVEPALIHEIGGSGDGFSVSIVAGEPAAARNDRKHLQVFVNGRRVWEYALSQAVEYAYRDYLRGGVYPSAYLFVDIDPALIDFNVHPAKREVRFRNLPGIHRRVVEVLGSFLHAFDRRMIVQEGPELPYSASARTLPEWNRTVSTNRPAPPTGEWRQSSAPPGAPAAVFDLGRTFSPSGPLSAGVSHERRYRYLGQALGVFLVVELDQSLYLVDQHAAHERLVFDRLRAGSGAQELLFPVHLELTGEEASLLVDHREHLERLGIEVRESDGAHELVSVPTVVDMPPEELAGLIMDLLGRPMDFERELFASLSCRGAIMDGDLISDATAHELIDGVIDLPNARCPHGRPVWLRLSRDELFQAVGRK